MIAGDIRIKLVDVELLTVQIRLVICSVDKAKEMGMDWWVNNPMFNSHAKDALNGDHLSGVDLSGGRTVPEGAAELFT